MKYIVLIGDGMADEPIESLDGLTPLQKANIPNMDRLASEGNVGIAATVPDGFPPGSDVANLGILGYDPRIYYTGRAPLEAASMGIEIGENDIAYRCNLVCLSNGPGGESVMDDYSSGHISTDEAKALIDTLNKELGGSNFVFYPGVSYRHLMLWKDGKVDIECTPPHDITGKGIEEHLPNGKGADVLKKLMIDSVNILTDHTVNQKRVKENKKPGNSAWLWGQGKKPRMPLFRDIYGIDGALISAVDLTKGLGVCAGLKVIDVPGATGYLDTNYEGKAQYGFEALKEVDFLYLHVEAPDEAGHMGDLEAKIQAIEDFDSRVVGTILDLLGNSQYRMLVMPDHATPIKIKTHNSVPVPFILYDNSKKISGIKRTYDEGIKDLPDSMYVKDSHMLMTKLVRGDG